MKMLKEIPVKQPQNPLWRKSTALFSLGSALLLGSACAPVEEMSRTYQYKDPSEIRVGQSCPQCDLRYQNFKNLNFFDINIP